MGFKPSFNPASDSEVYGEYKAAKQPAAKDIGRKMNAKINPGKAYKQAYKRGYAKMCGAGKPGDYLP